MLLNITLLLLGSSIAYAAKGGQLKRIPFIGFLWSDEYKDKELWASAVFGNKLWSYIILFPILFYVFTWWLAIPLCIAWVLSLPDSVGEELGAFSGGGEYHSIPTWGYHTAIDFARQKAKHRGVYSGALFTLLTGFPLFILFGFLYSPVSYYLIQYFTVKKKLDGWSVSEFATGLLCIGLPLVTMYLANWNEVLLCLTSFI